MNDSNFITIYASLNPDRSGSLLIVANGESAQVHDLTPTGRQILDAARCHPTLEFALLRLRPGRIIDEVGPDEVVTLEERDTTFYAFNTDRLYYFVLNDIKYPWGETLPESILRLLADTSAHAQIWMERRDRPDEQLLAGQSADLDEVGVERFYTVLPRWDLDVQGVIVHSSTSTITVRHALELAKINPNLPWTFILKVEGRAKEQVEIDSVIDLAMPGIERLRVMPKVINNGEGPSLKRHFPLLASDELFLDGARLRWETTIDSGRRWLLLHDYSLPPGYQTTHITLAIEIPLLYPSAELDMFYCFPSLVLSNGSAILQTEYQQPIFGDVFQRWSRHRNGAVWSPDDDCVMTHLGLVEESLLREVAP